MTYTCVFDDRLGKYPRQAHDEKEREKTELYLLVDQATSDIVPFAFDLLQRTENVRSVHVVEKLHEVSVQMITVGTARTTEVSHTCFKITDTGLRRRL